MPGTNALTPGTNDDACFDAWHHCKLFFAPMPGTNALTPGTNDNACSDAWHQCSISQDLEHSIDIETLLALFFRRSAKVIETQNTFWYRFESNGLSRKFQIILGKIIDGFNRISLSLKGKKIIAQLI